MSLKYKIRSALYSTNHEGYTTTEELLLGDKSHKYFLKFILKQGNIIVNLLVLVLPDHHISQCKPGIIQRGRVCINFFTIADW